MDALPSSQSANARSNGQLKILSVASYVVVAASIVGLLFAHALLARSIAAQVLQGVAVLLMIWARITFGSRSFHFAANPTQGGLVTWGPYRFIRHPIYSAIVLWVLAAVASNWSSIAAALGVAAIGATLVRIACEERLLASQFADYLPYQQRTKRLIPFIW